MDQWYYADSGEHRGPVTMAELKNHLSNNRIHAGTLVWRDGMREWTPAGTVLAAELSPYASPSADALAEVNWSNYQPTGPQVRPWVRYWARTADILSFSLVVGFFLGLAIPDIVTRVPDTVFGIILLLVYNFVEPLFLTLFGATPFKALLNVRVRNPDGSKLDYGQALKRTHKVWLRGTGLGLPIVTLVTHIMAYTRLDQKRITSWDAEGPFTVSHRIVEWWRWLLSIAFLVGFVCITVYGAQAG